jgi:hypothetical protein
MCSCTYNFFTNSSYLNLLLQIQDAQAAMKLYTMNKKNWEKDMKNKHRHIKKGPKKKKKK